jgi:hypothetical protein
MHSTQKPKQTDDPHDFLVVAPDDIRVVPTDEELSSLMQDLARAPSHPQLHTSFDFPAEPEIPPVDTTFRPAAVGDVLARGQGRSIGARALRACAALLLATFVGVAAIAWQARGDVTKRVFTKWAPQFMLTSLELPGSSAQPTPPAVEAAAANVAPAQAAAPAETTADSVAPTAAEASGETAQLMQSMTRDLASLGQEVEQLKASIEQLKASQQQISRDVAKASENKASRPRTPAPPPRPATAPAARRPISSFPPRQAAAASALPPAAPYVPRPPESQPQAIAQPQPGPEWGSVPRPPMPVRSPPSLTPD